MGMGQATIRAVRQFRADHPEVDWTTHVPLLRLDHEAGTAEVVGFRPRDPSDDIPICCDPGNCSTHDGRETW